MNLQEAIDQLIEETSAKETTIYKLALRFHFYVVDPLGYTQKIDLMRVTDGTFQFFHVPTSNRYCDIEIKLWSDLKKICKEKVICVIDPAKE